MSRIFDLRFRVIRWSDRSTVIEVVAQCLTFSVAEAAWHAAMTAWPGEEITLQHGIRIMKRGKGGREK